MKLKNLAFLIAVLALASCNAVENDSTSGTMLQIVSLTASDGKLPVFSSVSVKINDNCLLEINALPLDPLMDGKNVTPYMDVLVDQIDVEFRRTDGRNVEGTDVPYRFTQPMSFLVTINGSAKIPFMLIRHMAKEEPPLLALTSNPEVLQLVAVVTIHGKDLGGHRVAPVTGYVSVFCAKSFGTTVTTGIDR
jgi:hypothetical protein